MTLQTPPGALSKSLFLCFAVILIILFALTLHTNPLDGATNSSPSGNSYLAQLRASLPNSIRKRLQRSELLWERSREKRSDLIERLREQDGGIIGAFDTVFNVWDLVPATFTCPHEMERIGRLGPGGKWICGMSVYSPITHKKPTNPCVVYSLGLQSQSSFEEALIWRTSCSILALIEDGEAAEMGKQFPFLSKEQQERVEFEWLQKGEILSVRELMEARGDAFVDVLRVSLSSAGENHELLRGVLKEFGGSAPMGQIIVRFEVDERKESEVEEFLELVEQLEEAGMRPVWSEARSSDGSVCEYTFINVRNADNEILFE